MAVTNPKKSTLTAYAGNTFDFLYTFEDQDGNDIDLAADYDDIEFRIFQYGSKDNPYVSLTLNDGDLSITNTNELNGTVTKSKTENAPAVLYYEMEFTLTDGSVEVYLFGRFKVESATSSSGEASADLTITINQNTNDVTFSESYDAAAKATQAKEDAETAESNAQTSESNASDSASDAEKHAQNTTSFTDSDGDSFDKGAQGYADDAATSESNASTSETNAADDAEDAKNQAQATSSFTDNNGDTYDKGAKGYAEEAESTTKENINIDLSLVRANHHEKGKPLWLPRAKPANVVEPPNGYEALFLDSTNSNKLSTKDSSGTVTEV